MTYPRVTGVVTRQGLGNMSPGFALHQCVDRGPTDTIMLSPRLACSCAVRNGRANQAYSIGGEFRVMMGFTMQQTRRSPARPVRFASRPPLQVQPRPVPITHRGTPFRVHVSGVVSMGSKKQMIWANAGRIVARMAHQQALRNHAQQSCIQPTMCHCSVARQAKTAVSGTPTCAAPQPTRLSTLYMGPESFQRVYTGILIRHAGASFPYVAPASVARPGAFV